MFEENSVHRIEQESHLGAAAYPSVKLKSSIVLIAPDEGRLQKLTKAIEAQGSAPVSILTYYPNYNSIISLAEADCDAIVVELDTDSDTALDVVEGICGRRPASTVMVYSKTPDPNLMMASMRAGAREFLCGEIAPEAMADALLRAAARRVETGLKKTQAKILLFWGAKGGSGVTTLATNFALALQKEVGGEVVLADLNPQLGDVAVLLGLSPQFTLADALRNPDRLDGDFVSTMLTKHRSGLSVLAAPDTYALPSAAHARATGKLVELVGSQFRYVVVDAGLGLGECAESLFHAASTVYLVTQADIPSLRNSQRLLAYLKSINGVSVELVLNRFEPRKLEFDEERMGKAIGMAPKWKMPNDYAAARRAANAGTPLIAEKSPVAEALRQMARSACGKPVDGDRKKGFRFLG